MDCGEQGGKKVMCWAGVVLGKLIIHWFEDQKSVNGDTYLEMLTDVVWPKFRWQAERVCGFSRMEQVFIPPSGQGLGSCRSLTTELSAI